MVHDDTDHQDCSSTKHKDAMSIPVPEEEDKALGNDLRREIKRRLEKRNRIKSRVRVHRVLVLPELGVGDDNSETEERDTD
jgi:hypothetical protein